MSRHRRQPRSVSSCTNRPPLHCDSMSPSSLSLSRPACRASGRERVGRGWAPDATRPSTREVRLVRFRSDPPERQSPCKPIDFSGDGLVPVTPQSDAATHRQQHRPHKSQLLRSVAACRGGSSRATRSARSSTLARGAYPLRGDRVSKRECPECRRCRRRCWVCRPRHRNRACQLMSRPAPARRRRPHRR